MLNFTDLYDKYVDSLFLFGCKFTSDRELIKDCIQDVFVKLYTRREQMNNVENIKSYLFTSLRNRIHDEFRRNVHNSDEEVDESIVKDLNDDDNEKDILEMRDKEMSCIDRCYDKLSPRQREVIKLYYLEQRKYDEICEIMGINYQSVRNLMHRTLSHLRNLTAKAAF